MPKLRYNVAKSNGRIMLIWWVDTLEEAEKWLKYYKETYEAGKPYPNGKGVYPESGFHIVMKDV